MYIAKRKTLYFDFETTQNPKAPLVYSWGIGYKLTYGNLNPLHPSKIYKGMRIHYGISIETFMNFIEGLDCDTKLFSFNGAKFDNHFILSYLKRNYTRYFNNYNFQEKITPLEQSIAEKRLTRVQNFVDYTQKRYDNIKNDVRLKTYIEKYLNLKPKQKWTKMIPFEFDEITDNNKTNFYTEFCTGRIMKRSWRARNHTLNDLKLLLPGDTSVKMLGETLNKKFNTDNYSKLSIQYDRKELYNDIKEFENDGNELNYLFQDIYIIYSFHTDLQNQIKEKGFDNLKWTSASSTYRYWIYSLGSKINKEKNFPLQKIRFKNGVIKFGSKTLYSGYSGLVRKELPYKWLDSNYDEETGNHHQYLYNWYKGGLVKVNEKYRGIPLYNITKIDINSSYPSQMCKDVLVPIGQPSLAPAPNHNFKFYKVIVLQPIINKKGLPWLSSPGYFRDFPQKLEVANTLYLTDIDIDNFKKYYGAIDKVNVDIQPIYYFKTKPLSYFFKDYIYKMYEGKKLAVEKNDLTMKIFYKVMLNSLYGKLGTKKVRLSKKLMGMDWLTKTTHLTSKYYLPLAIVITSLAKQQLVETVGDQYHKFVYCDTDSITFYDVDIKKDFPHIKLDDTKLGAWTLEHPNVFGLFRRPKQYIIQNDKHKWVAFAGIDTKRNDKNKIDTILSNLHWKDLINGKKIPNQLQSKKTDTGIYLKPIDKDIPPIWTYKVQLEQKFWDKESYFKHLLDFMNEEGKKLHKD